MTPDRYWRTIGRFQVLALPLHLNPYWTTHHIYLNGKLVGKQLSVPNEADCEWYVTIRAVHVREVSKTFSLKRRPGPGRPRKEDAYRKWLEALAS